PGFGGTDDLPGDRMDFAGYADWVAEFTEKVGIDEPFFLVGHSFGGGVAIKLAHDWPEKVRYVVLVNSVGGSAWKGEGASLRTLAERPLWDWGLHFPGDIFPLPQLRKVLPVMLEDFLPNALRNPLAFWRVGN